MIREWGSYIGLLLGVFADYFMFGYLFYLAEIGRFSSWSLFLLLLPPLLGYLIGGLFHKGRR